MCSKYPCLPTSVSITLNEFRLVWIEVDPVFVHLEQHWSDHDRRPNHEYPRDEVERQEERPEGRHLSRPRAFENVLVDPGVRQVVGLFEPGLESFSVMNKNVASDFDILAALLVTFCKLGQSSDKPNLSKLFSYR